MKQEIQGKLKDKLWDSYVKSLPEFPKIFGSTQLIIDHYAIIDLPSRHSGIPHLKAAFEMFGLKERGQGYLPQKQNDFLWLADSCFEDMEPAKATPQVVLADFRLNELSTSTRKIVEKYAKYRDEDFDLELFKMATEDDLMVNQLVKHVNTRPWPQPSLGEYLSVNEENPLLAWVLLFGRRVNHFGIGIYAMGEHSSLHSFNTAIQEKITLSPIGGLIKGDEACGIEQSSTIGAAVQVNFDGKIIETNDCFLEFVWRHPITNTPKKMRDYYMDFLPTNADKVIESLYGL